MDLPIDTLSWAHSCARRAFGSVKFNRLRQTNEQMFKGRRWHILCKKLASSTVEVKCSVRPDNTCVASSSRGTSDTLAFSLARAVALSSLKTLCAALTAEQPLRLAFRLRTWKASLNARSASAVIGSSELALHQQTFSAAQATFLFRCGTCSSTEPYYGPPWYARLPHKVLHP